ncbi:dynein associated protein-domain-containing protein [Halteromyces radiatus]|uniref:dynein associated protein-domain-containing protein n=1 Tax=Halteromyces radiatus TaxID=101107 RepID=UPI00221FA188|nr:dynein associated protein-domain-containing protein [Halteromyces radiatus]KAI8092701.1 dynein associated protein-domain-containing protein [Halteromyces radiatus]
MSSRNSSPHDSSGDISSDLRPGTRIQVQGKIGTIRYTGTTSFQTGKWIGIELDEPQGKNSGVVQGKRYFDCRTNHGVFVRPSQVKLLPSSPSPMSRSGSEGGSSTRSGRSSTDSSRFAPPLDANLAAARSTQQRTPSPSSTLLPSRLSSPRRIQQRSSAGSSPTAPRTTNNITPTASLTTGPRRSLIGNKTTTTATITRPRSGTLGSSTQQQKENTTKELRQAQLQKLRLSQQQQQQQQQQSVRQLLEDNDRYNITTASTRYYSQQQQQDDNDKEEEEELEDDNQVIPMDYTRSHSSISDQDSMDQTQSPTGIKTTSHVYGALDTSIPISKSDQTVPLKDYDELRFKLKILESKRQEDREKYREHEKIKEEAEQFLTLRNKLQDKISELQKELREAKKESKENDADRESFEIKYNDALESLEMMTLDKEVAEERAEHLQQEVNVLKDKLEEINVDLDILRKDADILNQPPENTGDEKTPLEVIQLERHNERLKDALLRLRDATTEHEAELNRRIKELERENHELTEIRAQFTRTKEKLEISDNQNEILKQRLDDALGAEDLVEQLAEKNLNLTEKLEELLSAVDDLEALKELADELEENHLETEKQLQAEIDHRDMLLREQLERIRSMEETSADYEATIQQFRELVIHLQSDLERLRHKQESQQTEKQDLSSQSQAMMSLNMQLQSTVMKAQAKAIDLELRKLDAMQATDKLSYIQPYLPDVFFKTENDAISCFLLFKRLVFKSELIIKHLDQNHPISEKIMDTVTENLVSVCELRQRAGWLSDIAKRFVTFIKHCKPEIFTKLGQVYHDLVGTERRLNGIVELLRTDELNEADCILELQRMIAQLEHLTEVYLVPNGPSNHVDQFFGLTRALDFNADRMAVEFTFVRQAVENAARKDGIKITEGYERLDYDYLEPLSRLVVQSKNSKMMARKLLRQLDDLAEQALTPKAEHLHRFKTLYAISSKVSRFCFETYKQIAIYVDTKRGSKEEIRLANIQQIVYNKADEILEIAESTMWEGALNTLKSLTNELSNTFTRVESDNKMDKIATGTAPWIQRASDIKAEVIVDHDKDRKLQQHADEILKLIKDVKMKDQSLQEAGVKVELLEKRMEAAKKQADQISVLQETLQKSQSQEQMYAEAMENLQTEYDSLEQENAKLKKLVSVQEESTRSLVSSSSVTPKKPEYDMAEGTSTLETSSSSLMTMSQQVDSLKSAIRYLRAENAHLKSCDMARSIQLDQLPPVISISQQKQTSPSSSINSVSKDSDDQSTTTLSTLVTEEDDNGKNKDSVRSLIRSYAMETRALLKDIRTASASPKLISLAPDHRNGKWQRRKHTPEYQYQTQQSVLYTLKQRSDTLRIKMEKLQPTQISTEAKEKTTAMSNMISTSLAKIQLPRRNILSSPAHHCVQLQSFKEFERIHTLFIH